MWMRGKIHFRAVEERKPKVKTEELITEVRVGSNSFGSR
jgi:hypothetical protein